jgi:hypothetical protein
LGTSIVFEHQWTPDGRFIPTAETPGKWWLKRVLGEHYAAHPITIEIFYEPLFPSMKASEFTDEDVQILTLFPKLNWIVLNDTVVTDDGIQSLHGIPALQRLDVERTLVTEQGVREFQQARPDVKVFF